MEKISLIIEGGGLRGFFSAGTLQCLLDHDIRIPYIIGVSSGSMNAVGYAVGDLSTFFQYAGSSQRAFIQWRNLQDIDRGILDTGRFFNAAGGQFSQLCQAGVTMKLAATRAQDAQQLFFEKSQFKSSADLALKLQASAAIPVLMPKTSVDGAVYVDGGIIDSIPVGQALQDGRTRHIIITTRPSGYRKAPQAMEYFLRKWLKPYPELKDAMATRHIRYNRTMDQLATMENAGAALVIRPLVNRLGRIEFDVEKFHATYEDGYAITKERIEELRAFIRTS